MNLLDNLMLGLSTALSLQNLSYAFLGCLLGTLVGVLPGLGPLAAISLLLPVTYGLEPTTALIMLAGIYYGSAYGGSTTAILINLPGETSSAVTALDGYKMAQQGRAGIAIAAAAIGSFVAGCFGVLILVAFATPLASFAIKMGAAEYFSLMLLGLVGAVSLSSGSVVKAIGMILIGVSLGLVGTDMSSGVNRFTFGQPHLWDGLSFIVLAVGLFAIGEVIASLEQPDDRSTYTDRVGRLLPGPSDLRRMAAPILRGTAIGSLFGALPGAGLSMASFFSYGIEKRVSRYRDEVGQGAIEGVAGPESANNAAAQTAFIPTLTLGIPGSPTMALMLGALIMNNIQPGPSVIRTNPELFWGLIVSMWIGNVMLLALNLPLVSLWVKLLKIPYRLLFPAILLFCCLGTFLEQLSAFDVFLAAGFGVVGYVFKKLDCAPAPLILGFVLGPMLEDNFRRALVLSQGDLSVFVREPISLTLLCLTAALIIFASIPYMRRKRDDILVEEQ